MGKYLICAEKPSQAKALAAPFSHSNKGDHIFIEPCKMFPEGAIVISAIGHILELFGPGDYSEELKKWDISNLPIIPETYKLKVIESKKKSFMVFKKYLNDPSISCIIHAGDPASEGQLLLDEIFYYLNNKKPVKRLWASSLTKESIKLAFENLIDNKKFYSLYLSALARQRADWLVGISSSRAITCLLNKTGINKTFSAGRVQTSLLAIIYKREIEIETFVSEPYFDLYATFEFGNDWLKGKWISKEAEHIFDLGEDVVQDFANYCKLQPAVVHSVQNEEKKEPPPQLYSLSTLQIQANKLYGMSPDKVLSYAQALYEKAYITYPRSDSNHLTQHEAKWLPTILENLAEIEIYNNLVKMATNDISNNKRYVDEKKVSDHYAIIPTETKVNPVTLPKGEKEIYDLIAKSVIVAHFDDYVYHTTEILIHIDDQFAFKSKGKQVKQLGWKSAYQNEDHQGDETILPNLKEGDIGKVVSTEITNGSTTPPPRFTMGDLVKIMKNAAHYCDDREDFKNSELSLGTEATRSGIIQVLMKRYLSVEKNKVYLQPEGRILIEAVGQGNFLTSVLTTGRMERNLREIEKGKGTVNDFLQKTEIVVKGIVNKLIQDSEKWDFQNYIEDIQKSSEIGSCLMCGGPVVERESFYGCSKYKENNCTFTIPKEKAGKAINKANVVKLLNTGQTSLIKGFQSKKKDKLFDAFLYWDDVKKKVIFKFPN